MTNVKLIVHEPAAGSFYWALVESDINGKPTHEVQAAEAESASYEAALDAGTRALRRLLAHEPDKP
jgi:hypothetical protein